MTGVSKFQSVELEGLRGLLLKMGPDYQGASEVIQAFLSGRGYGISPESARDAAVEFGTQGYTLECMGRVLNLAALVA